MINPPKINGRWLEFILDALLMEFGYDPVLVELQSALPTIIALLSMLPTISLSTPF
jgi:hypothetical protein